jgi:hypothetical protein
MSTHPYTVQKLSNLPLLQTCHAAGFRTNSHIIPNLSIFHTPCYHGNRTQWGQELGEFLWRFSDGCLLSDFGETYGAVAVRPYRRSRRPCVVSCLKVNSSVTPYLLSPFISVARLQLPIESNPEVMNTYLSNLGFPISEYKCYDVLSTEDWALEMVPRPVKAVLMLFPIKPVVRTELKINSSCRGSSSHNNHK